MPKVDTIIAGIEVNLKNLEKNLKGHNDWQGLYFSVQGAIAICHQRRFPALLFNLAQITNIILTERKYSPLENEALNLTILKDQLNEAVSSPAYLRELFAALSLKLAKLRSKLSSVGLSNKTALLEAVESMVSFVDNLHKSLKKKSFSREVIIDSLSAISEHLKVLNTVVVTAGAELGTNYLEKARMETVASWNTLVDSVQGFLQMREKSPGAIKVVKDKGVARLELS